MPPPNKPAGSAHGTDRRGLNLSDAYFVLFRHKWKILFCGLLGILAAAGLYVTGKPVYQSEAKLLVRYVYDNRAVDSGTQGGSVRAPATTAETIINGELQILTSMDLFEQVAIAVGPERILGQDLGDSNVTAAARALFKGLIVEVPRRSTIIIVRLTHADPEIAQSALNQLIDIYFKKHAAIHRAVGAFDTFLSQQTDQLRSRLMQTEEDLRKAKQQAGIVSLQESKAALALQTANLRQNLFATEAELAEYQALLKNSPQRPSTSAITNDAVVPQDKISEYTAARLHFEAMRAREFDLAAQFTPENPVLKRLREQMAEHDNVIKRLEQEYPRLASLHFRTAPAQSPLPGAPLLDPARVGALEAKLKVVNSQLEKVRGEAAAIDELEGRITQLERKKALEEKNYQYFAAGLEQSRFDEALGSGKLSNINVVQAPTKASTRPSSRLKLVGLALFGGFFAGIALALLNEFLLDRTLKRPMEVESRFHLPLLSAIPRFRRKLMSPKAKGLRRHDAADDSVGLVLGPEHPLYASLDAIRDQLLMHFEGNHNKPKLVGVTGCRRGSGVSTLAAGVAAALSETGEGKVLLLDLNPEKRSAHPFLKGRPSCPVADALKMEKREMALVTQNLYAAATSVEQNGGRILPLMLSRVFPELRVSDYDYVVFDMPHINGGSVSARLAGMLDYTLLVVEAEKDSRDAVQRAVAKLSESKACVSAVVNKVRNYVPARLLPEH